MDNVSNNTLPAKSTVKTRRRYTPEFRDRIIHRCKQPGVSVAGVARENGMNANLLHRWIKAESNKSLVASDDVTDFLPLPLAIPPATDQTVRIDIGKLSIHWPVAHINQAVPWLKALQS